ncbi:MAG: amidohydrolase family protein [Loktanella sp.]|nr:amidohydrolase family protein [Loktanella sp.]
MFDLLIRGATLPDGRRNQDVAVRDGRIVDIALGIEGQAAEIIEAEGHLLSPPFVDPHFHMDATLSLGQPRMNLSGTLLEGIALWGELRPSLTREAVVERALRYCDLAVSKGLLAVRTHVDVSDPRLVTVEGLLEVRERVAPYLDLQLVAFPQDGYYRSPQVAAALSRALDMGVDVVGGIPHFERTMEDGRASIEALCRIAAERGLRVDMHCDETDDPLSRHVETLAAQTVRFGLQGRVAGSHLTSMHSMDNYYVSKLLPLVAEQDCVLDPWYAMGSGDMLDVAHMAVHATQMGSVADKKALFDAITVVPARLLGLTDYGLEPGCHADMVLLQARDTTEAIRLRPNRLKVIRRGKVIAETPPERSRLSLDGRPGAVDPSDYAPKAMS